MRLIGMDFVSQSILRRINSPRRYLGPFLSICRSFARAPSRFCFHTSSFKWYCSEQILLHSTIGPILNDRFESLSKHFEWLHGKLCISKVAIFGYVAFVLESEIGGRASTELTFSPRTFLIRISWLKMVSQKHLPEKCVYRIYPTQLQYFTFTRRKWNTKNKWKKRIFFCYTITMAL